MGLAILDIGGGWNSPFLYRLYYNSRVIWCLVYQPGYLSYPNCRIFTGDNLSPQSLSVSSSFLSAPKHFPDCCSVRPSPFSLSVKKDCCFREHLPRALPTDTIFNLLRSISSDCLISGYSPGLMLDTLEVIIKWLLVSVSEYNQQTPETKKSILCLGTWFRATKRLVLSFQG